MNKEKKIKELEREKDFKFYINFCFIFLITFFIFSFFVMGSLSLLNSACQKSDECIGEEREITNKVTIELWNAFKLIIPIILFILLITYLIIKRKNKYGEKQWD